MKNNLINLKYNLRIRENLVEPMSKSEWYKKI